MRLRISAQLAIFALIELGMAPDRQLSVADIGEKYGVSSHHLAKVMHTLQRARLVRAVRGAGGGYQFSGNARRATLLDVIELFENVGSADIDAGESTAEGRALRQVLLEVGGIARATLGSISLATMFKLIDRNRDDRPRSAAKNRPAP